MTLASNSKAFLGLERGVSSGRGEIVLHIAFTELANVKELFAFSSRYLLLQHEQLFCYCREQMGANPRDKIATSRSPNGLTKSVD